jgi:cobalt-precorrin 5A hydrolase
VGATLEDRPHARGKEETAVYALTPQGADLARRLADALRGDLFLPATLAARHGARPFDGLLRAVAGTFPRYGRHVFVAAAGIVVRAIAPHIRTKERDPAVVVLDSEGRFVVSLLSGHLGGANALAREAAAVTGGAPVITTATDTAGLPSWDLLAAERGLVIADTAAVKALNMAMLRGETVSVSDPENRLGLFSGTGPSAAPIVSVEEKGLPEDGPAVTVTWRSEPERPGRLVLHPRCLAAGVGCNRGTSSREIVELLESTFASQGLARASLAGLATIDAKRDEAGLLEAAGRLGVPVTFYPAGDLRAVSVPTPSETVKRHMGVESVCEAAAIKRAGEGRLLVPKVRSRNATLAVALEGSSS